MGSQAALGIPAHFFTGEPARTLNEGPFDLTDVERRIERGAGVVQDVGTFNAHLARQGVDRDLRAGDAVSEVVERAALEFGAIPVNLGRAVKALRRE